MRESASMSLLRREGHWFRTDEVHWQGRPGINVQSGEICGGPDYVIYFDSGGILDREHIEIGVLDRQKALKTLNENARLINEYLRGAYVYNPINEKDLRDFC